MFFAVSHPFTIVTSSQHFQPHRIHPIISSSSDSRPAAKLLAKQYLSNLQVSEKGLNRLTWILIDSNSSWICGSFQYLLCKWKLAEYIKYTHIIQKQIPCSHYICSFKCCSRCFHIVSTYCCSHGQQMKQLKAGTSWCFSFGTPSILFKKWLILRNQWISGGWNHWTYCWCFRNPQPISS